MRQINAVNGSQMVVKIGVVYYRRKQGHTVKGHKLSSLLYTITTDFSTIKKRHSAAAECLADCVVKRLKNQNRVLLLLYPARELYYHLCGQHIRQSIRSQADADIPHNRSAPVPARFFR